MENQNNPSPIINEKKKFQWTDRQKNIICGIVAAPAVLLLLIAGVCKAYEVSVQWYLENSLASNVTAARSTAEACNSSYQAIAKWKDEMKIAKTGSGNPCPFSPAL